ncbi:membrane-bound lytic murein transglycosylase D [Gammaproteobacteria bacterium]
MKKIILTLSSLFAISLSGCASDPAYQKSDADSQDNPDSLVLKGQDESNSLTQEEEGNTSGKIDWLTAWWKKSESELTPSSRVKNFGFSHWFTKTPIKKEHNDLEENVVSLWDTVGDLVTLTEPDHPRIQKEANFYARNQRFLDYISEQAEPYFNFVLGEVQRRNMPVEVALLPAVESAYQPRATSPRRAAGLWQLIPGTARHWGLELNQHYDGRRDVFASTHAALDYLQKLNDDFEGDWLLTMAAYNCGEFSVSRAIRRNLAHGKPTDFWSLELPAETRAFVPRILGLAAVIAEPQNYGVQLKTLRDRPVVSVKIDYQVDLAKVAEIADISLHEMKRLNPAYRQGKTDSEGGNFLLPEPQARLFEARLAAMDPQELSPFQRASDAPPVEADIKPVSAAPEPSTENAITNRAPVQMIHVVRRGDTLGSLARAAGVRVKDIIAWNHLKSRVSLHPGQRLTLSQGTEAVVLTKSHGHTDQVNKHGRIKATILARGKHHDAQSLQHQRHSVIKAAHNKHSSRTHGRHS